MRLVSDEERRARLARRHLLAAPGGSPRDVANALVALHATDPATVYLSCLVRMGQPSLEAVDRALHDERCLVRMLGMRRTVFAVDVDLLAVVESSSSRRVAANERLTLIRAVEAAGIAEDGDAWFEDVAAQVTSHLGAVGGATAVELAAAIPALRNRIVLGAGTRWEGHQRVNSRVLLVMGAEGRILRGETGSWTGSRYRWYTRDQWLRSPTSPADTAAAQAELVARWLRAFGPGTVEDIRWWTGWTVGEVRRALEAVRAAEVEVSGGPAYLLAEDLGEEQPVHHWVALLPTLDPTIMGWKQRDWYLGPHKDAVFDSTGNAGPTVWVDGRVVGAWAHHPDGTIRVEYLEELARSVVSEVEAAAERLVALLGDDIVVPRFKSMLSHRLAGG